MKNRPLPNTFRSRTTAAERCENLRERQRVLKPLNAFFNILAVSVGVAGVLATAKAIDNRFGPSGNQRPPVIQKQDQPKQFKQNGPTKKVSPFENVV